MLYFFVCAVGSFLGINFLTFSFVAKNLATRHRTDFMYQILWSAVFATSLLASVAILTPIHSEDLNTWFDSLSGHTIFLMLLVCISSLVFTCYVIPFFAPRLRISS
jgi:hypothetical protein